MIYHVQYEDNGWHGTNGNLCYECAETEEVALEAVKCAVADKIQQSEQKRIADARTYESETVPCWQECYESASKYRYRIRKIETDGFGNIAKSEWK